MNGVTLEFYCKALNALVRRHGNRALSTDGRGEELRAALEKAEQIYCSFEPVPKPKRQRKTKGKS